MISFAKLIIKNHSCKIDNVFNNKLTSIKNKISISFKPKTLEDRYKKKIKAKLNSFVTRQKNC